MAMVNNQQMLLTAREQFNKGNFRTAENLLQEVVLSDPKNPEIFHLLGCIHYKFGRIKKSLKSFRTALEIDPKYTDATVGLSMVLNDTGRYAEAQKIFEDGQESVEKKDTTPLDNFLEEQLAAKHLELGQLYFQYQRYDEAIEQYFEAYKYVSNKMEVRLKIVDCFLKKGETTRAMKELRMMIQDHPHLTEARIKLGMIYYKGNRTLEAVEQWESVLLRDPEHPEALKLLQMAQNKQTTVLDAE